MSRHALRWAVVVWAIVVVVISIRVGLKPGSHSVYPIFTDAGRNWLAGAEVYGELNRGLDQFRYTPVVAAAFAPWAWLPDRAGEVLWRVLNVVVFLAGLVAFVRWWRGGTGMAAVLLLVVPLAVGGLNNGQCNLLVAGLLLGAVVAFDNARWSAAAALIAGATMLKGYPAALGLLFVLLQPSRFAPRLVLAVAAGLVVPFVLQRPAYVADQYAAFVDRLRGDDRTAFLLHAGYRDFQMLLRACGVPTSLKTYRLIEVGAGLLCAIAVVWVHRRSGVQRNATWAAAALGLCWMTLFGPATESCTYVLVAPILAHACLDAAQRSRGQRLLAYGSFALFIVSVIGVWFPPWFNARLQSFGPQPAAAVLLLGAALMECARLARRMAEPAVESDLARAA